jgi:hypothetical protein
MYVAELLQSTLSTKHPCIGVRLQRRAYQFAMERAASTGCNVQVLEYPAQRPLPTMHGCKMGEHDWGWHHTQLGMEPHSIGDDIHDRLGMESRLGIELFSFPIMHGYVFCRKMKFC